MKRNVLLTTDFSENSKRAFKGAVSLAKKLDGKLILCYVVNDMDYVPSVSPIGGESVQSVILQKEFLDKEVERKQESLEELVNEEIDYDNSESMIMKGSLEDGLNEAIEEHDIAFVVTASNGESDLFEKIFGSNALNMMRNLKAPVLALSAGAKEISFDNMAYAVSSFYENEKYEKAIIGLAKAFDAKIDFLHVEDSDYELYEKQESLLKTEVDYMNYKNLKLVMQDAKSPFEGIKKYTENNDCDLLALVSHTDNIFERIFHSSVVNKALQELNTPILCYNKNCDLK